MNKDKVKKIVSISIIAVVLALVIVTIILAIVPKRFEDPISSDYSTITIYRNGVSQQYIYNPNAQTDAEKSNNAVYNKIKELYKDSLKDSVLSALFQGTGSFKTRVVNDGISNVVSSKASGSDITALVFTYLGEDSQVLKVNGEEYRDKDTQQWDRVTYNMVVLPLNTSDTFEESTVYLSDSTDPSSTSSYQVKFLAHHKALYDYIAGLTFGILG